MTDAIQRLSAALADRYAVERELGAGGMATVYLAEDLKHRRKVALKVLRPELAAVLGAERFLNEISVTANLQHPNILPLYDSGQAGDFLYYVMPYVEGESLRALLEREGRLDPKVAAKIGIAAAEALHFAHRRGIIHRDVKPENILLQDGKALVADFGIALAVTEAGGGRLTETGLSVGSPRYMSPEQAAGERHLDARSDVYALGTTLYEALAGHTPFSAESLPELLARLVTEEAPPVAAARPDLPPEMAAAIDRALASSRDNRFASAEAFAQALEASLEGRPTRVSPRQRRVTLLVAGLLAVGVSAVGIRWYRDAAGRRWVREVVVPDLERLVHEDRFGDAYALARRALDRRPGDSTLRTFLEAVTESMTITSDPSGASVLFRGYRSTDSTWFDAGVTPVESVPVVAGQVRLRFTLDGYRPLEVSVVSSLGDFAAQLVPEATPDDMVWVPSGTISTTTDPLSIDAFRIDRLEVTNREYQAFVDRGGYGNDEHWVEPFVRDGRVLPRNEAMSRFVDQTGRPGPAGWELGRHPPDRGDYPVGGVSWYEAAAFCRARGAVLPSYYHWRRAADFGMGVWDYVLEASNFGEAGPVPVGTSRGVGSFGTLDLAGNVREWVWNASGALRYIQGGAWSDPEYLYFEGEAIDPWSRDAGNGFRCAEYPSPPVAAVLDPIASPNFDFASLRPVDDSTFAIFRRFYEYMPTPLEARLERTDTASQWILQEVSYAAAYGNERITAFVFLPRGVTPPYQTVVYFPGGAAFRGRPIAAPQAANNLFELSKISFVPRSGRALVYPIYKGSYDRTVDFRGSDLARRQWVIWVTQDLQRTVDYVIERPDLHDDAIGYLGLSLGAEIAVPIALEKRFAALVLVGGAFDPAWREVSLPENAPWNFASRITTPVMLINGRRDFMHPYETGQVPYFDAFAVPDSAKEFVVLESGHVPTWNEVIANALRWYDRYLGPVRQERASQ